MSIPDTRSIVAGITVLWLFSRVFSAQWGVWGLAEWTRFFGHLAISAGLVWLGLLMAGGVDSRLAVAGRANSLARTGYVVVMMLIILYGVVSGIQTLLSSTGESYNPTLFRGYFLTFAVFTVVLGMALWVAGLTGGSAERMGLVVGGGFLLWVGVALPPWVQAAARGRLLTEFLSSTQLRAVYLLLGIGALISAVAGIPSAWFQ